MSKTKVRKPSLKKGNGDAAISAGTPADSAAKENSGLVLQNGSGTELSEKIKELVRLAQEQGHLTFNDINEALPENAVTPEKLDEVFSKLRALEIEIVDQADADNVKKSDAQEDNTHQIDSLNNPVRIYLHRMDLTALPTHNPKMQ